MSDPQQQFFWVPLLSAVLLAGGALALDAATEPETPYRETVEARIETEFRDQYRAGIVVHCPDEKAHKDHEFRCDGETDTGEKGELQVHVTADDGTFTWSVVEQGAPSASPSAEAGDRAAEHTLRAGQLAQEDYFTEHHRYTLKVSDLVAFAVPEGVDFRIVRADDKAYCLEAKSKGSEHPYTLSNDEGQPKRDGAC